MQTQTTAHLIVTRRDAIRLWLAQRDPVLLFAALVLPLIALLIIGAVLRQRPAQTMAEQPTPALPIMIIQTARAEPPPTAVPTATPDANVYAELERLRQRVDELEARPAPQPEVVYVQQPAPAYHVASQDVEEPPADMSEYRGVVAADPALAAHQAAEAADCDARGDTGSYCQLVRESIQGGR